MKKLKLNQHLKKVKKSKKLKMKWGMFDGFQDDYEF